LCFYNSGKYKTKVEKRKTYNETQAELTTNGIQIRKAVRVEGGGRRNSGKFEINHSSTLFDNLS